MHGKVGKGSSVLRKLSPVKHTIYPRKSLLSGKITDVVVIFKVVSKINLSIY